MDQNGKKHDIFISYRREGGLDTARYLYEHLTWDGYSVTFDLDSFRSGRFDEALLERIDECTDFVVVLNKGCFNRTLDPKFPRENDWLRMELGYAIGKKKNVIPVLLAGYEPPQRLPPDIREVLLMNGPKHSEEYIDAFYDKLKRFLHTPVPAAGRMAGKLPGLAGAAADMATCAKCRRWRPLTEMFACERCGKNYCLEHQDPATFLCEDCADALRSRNGQPRLEPHPHQRSEPATRAITPEKLQNAAYSNLLFFATPDDSKRKPTPPARTAETELEAALSAVRKSASVKGNVPRIGRNDPCPCGSGKKYKRCCGQNM